MSIRYDISGTAPAAPRHFVSIDGEEWISIQKELEQLRAENERLKREIDILRIYGNKDCTAMADDALTRTEVEK